MGTSCPSPGDLSMIFYKSNFDSKLQDIIDYFEVISFASDQGKTTYYSFLFRVEIITRDYLEEDCEFCNHQADPEQTRISLDLVQ